MKFFLLIILSLVFTSCSTQPENELPLFNNIVFHLEKGEVIEKIIPTSLELYDSLFNDRYSEIPLFRNISHQNYKLFIGLPFNTSYEKLKKSKTGKNDSTLISETVTDSCFFTKYHTQNFVVSEYLSIVNNNSMIYIAVLSNNEHKTDSLFSLTQFNNRISIK